MNCLQLPKYLIQSKLQGFKPNLKCRVACTATSMTNKTIEQTFQDLKARNKCAFIPFLCAGDPSLETTAKAIISLDRIGADIIELGVPYSDPLADGPTIQGAHKRGLDNGVKLNDVISLVAEVSPQITAKLVLFTYLNPIQARGTDLFCQQIKEAGAQGLLVPDIPLEETELIRQSTSKFGLELVLLITPATPIDRVKAIAQATQGFLYIVSVTGVTGERSQVSERVQGMIDLSRQVSDVPVAVGFGISKQDHVRTIKNWGADGVIVGSALVKELSAEQDQLKGLKNMEVLATDLVGGLQ
eukprot:TRINITY_DN14966_c0_g1_i1.p1 TRINITY_DN14966_c0_g1~~TRINITY_DN14966_c0_g1_i1.p1  ORF type:complete len:300 (-),score=31.99 TRINITY_DN14966_c0_g1_i1:712-1611(-)